MPARYEPVPLRNRESFYIGVFQDNLEKSTWHYHNNYELSFILEGTGKRIVGDSIEEFQPGDLVFIGRNLPHTWIANKEQAAWTSRTLEMVFLQFSPELVSGRMLDFPEFANARKAVELSEQGIHIVGDTLNEASSMMLKLPYLAPFERMLHFWSLLDIIGKSKSIKKLSSEDYMKSRFLPMNKRIQEIHEFLMKNYREEINLEQLAGLANMAPGSLCRYFKTQTGMTIFEYLLRIRVDFACKLLMDPDLNITTVCLDSGFNNLSHFNRQFKKYTGTTPTLYRDRFRGMMPVGKR
jgi:AraC-like DNA-binding protein